MKICRCIWILTIFTFLGLFLFTLESAAYDGFRLIKGKDAEGVLRNIKWGEPVFGRSAIIYYHSLEEPDTFDGGLSEENCTHMTALGDALKVSGMPLATFHNETKKALLGWSSVTNVIFVHTASLEKADVIIGAQATPNGIAWTNIDLKSDQQGQTYTIKKAAVCVNPLLEWRVVSPDTEKMPSVRRLIEHEFGHVLGLDHPDEGDHQVSVMAYKYLGEVAFTDADIDGAQFLYGSPKLVIPPK